MPPNPPVARNTFKAISNVDVEMLSELTSTDIRPILPCLVRMSLCPPLDSSNKWTTKRKTILKCLSGLEVVNSLVGLLSIDFYALEQDARKEQQLRAKVGNTQSESVLIASLTQSLSLEFERADAARKLRLLLSELLFVSSQIKEERQEFYQKSSELFENEVFLEEVSDVLCIAQAELPSLLPITDVAETLLHLPNGVWLLCRLTANVPDSFEEVCSHLVKNGEQQDEEFVGGRKRAEALCGLCDMNPQHALNVRSLCVEKCRMPGLSISLTLQYANTTTDQPSSVSDIVTFISGLLLGNNVDVRSWLAQYVKSGQKKKHGTTLNMLRQELLQELMQILPKPEGSSQQISEPHVIQGSTFIKLYCALKGIAVLKFHETEGHYLIQLVTCRPPRSAAGVRFACLGLCMVLVCPSLLGTIEQDRLVSQWISWLVKEVASFEKATGVKASYGEMLLLIAIHFHSGQTHAIADLVCSTLGMKIPVKTASLTRMKAIFMQEIFTEQVVASHAVSVSVTKELNANISGYLPVHCIYQLLKSRAFSKHKVPIKDWIFCQICHCTTPLHALLPPLIDVYIQSVILPSTKTDRANEPITEAEILNAFRNSVLTKHLGDETEDSGKATSHMSKNPKDKLTPEQEELYGHCGFTSQLLLLYYVLLYQDTVSSNIKTIVASNRKVYKYSPQLIAQLPMKYLLLQAQKEQQLYVGLFSSVLRLLATHYPHLCMVEDWLDEEMASVSLITGPAISVPVINYQEIEKAFADVQNNPSKLLLLLDQLITVAPSDLVPYADVLVNNLPHLLADGVPRHLSDITEQIWVKLNTVMPRKLRVMTVNSLRPNNKSAFRMLEYSEDDITVDPLIVLRCDGRVFRCPPIFQVNLRILEAFLQASKCYLANHIVNTPSPEKLGASLQEREELRAALIAAQESAAVQVLLECCLPDQTETEQNGLLNDVREIQCLVCSFLHQKFIADPNIAKLVHFQGYPSELLPITVAGIPSMHICLDYIPELLSQPHLEKQVFAVELVSYLSIQYALPKSLGVAKLAISVMNTVITILPSQTRVEFFQPILPALVRICKAFPPLCEDAIHLLTQLGRVCTAHLAAATNTIPSDAVAQSDNTDMMPRDGKVKPWGNCNHLSGHRELLNDVHKTFSSIVGSTALLKPLLPSEL